MKVPAKPPAPLGRSELAQLLGRAIESGVSAMQLASGQPYLPWDKFRFKETLHGMTAAESWHIVRMGRRLSARSLPTLLDKEGNPFWYNLSDEVLSLVDEITRKASGDISVPAEIGDRGGAERYVINSLIEEAITSSQLEGAATSRRDAKRMIRENIQPTNISERMIFNNYYAMQRVKDFVDEPLIPAIVLELHRIVTDGTLDDPAASGQLQQSQQDRVSVWGDGEQLLHRPPGVDELEGRLQALCDFANHKDWGGYLPPVLRAIAIHFMVGYDHYFEDGNGRTARALFYWSMLKEGFWLFEYLSISRILKDAPSRYARSFLLTEDDGGDLTHFFIEHLKVIQRSIEELHLYLAQKAEEAKKIRVDLAKLSVDVNPRQLALVEHAAQHPDAFYTVESHGNSHGVTTETARSDLNDLQSRGFLRRERTGRRHVWVPSPTLRDLLPR